eukprot:g3798.t1
MGNTVVGPTATDDPAIISLRKNLEKEFGSFVNDDKIHDIFCKMKDTFLTLHNEMILETNTNNCPDVKVSSNASQAISPEKLLLQIVATEMSPLAKRLLTNSGIDDFRSATTPLIKPLRSRDSIMRQNQNNLSNHPLKSRRPTVSNITMSPNFSRHNSRSKQRRTSLQQRGSYANSLPRSKSASMLKRGKKKKTLYADRTPKRTSKLIRQLGNMQDGPVPGKLNDMLGDDMSTQQFHQKYVASKEEEHNRVLQRKKSLDRRLRLTVNDQQMQAVNSRNFPRRNTKVMKLMGKDDVAGKQLEHLYRTNNIAKANLLEVNAKAVKKFGTNHIIKGKAGKLLGDDMSPKQLQAMRDADWQTKTVTGSPTGFSIKKLGPKTNSLKNVLGPFM